MRIEIWSDVACPWCYLGKRHLEVALDRFAHRDEVEVAWRSFELAPDLVREPGVDLHDHLAAKFGIERAAARAKNEEMTARAADAGLVYDLDRTVPARTFDAHRLVHVAAASGLADAAEEAVFAAYFTDGRDLQDMDTLADLGAGIGLDRTEVAAALASGAFADEVRRDEHEAQQLGIRAVPAFLIDRRFLISGAYPPEAMVDGLEQAWERSPAA
jgi:predicted DsbA family dithiol-disulfide isomerase